MERAEAFVAAETAAGIARVGAAVTGTGADVCADCGEAIDAARRKAAPFATRCVGCQGAYESRSRGR
ncbi:MAG: TraR/DksA C4-type zinc finger protein [Notoacmeibacter sp.]|nr:TraR/DksA C4-type zinc finger protein [Notoacmeibacter sp.]